MSLCIILCIRVLNRQSNESNGKYSFFSAYTYKFANRLYISYSFKREKKNRDEMRIKQYLKENTAGLAYKFDFPWRWLIGERMNRLCSLCDF